MMKRRTLVALAVAGVVMGGRSAEAKLASCVLEVTGMR
jgi:hypothetical protein